MNLSVIPFRSNSIVKKAPKTIRGVFEKMPGSGVWWVRYADQHGRIRREKAGTRAAAISLYQKRKTEVLEGRKFPERLRAKGVLFSALAADALEYSKVHKLSYLQDSYRMQRLLQAFGERSAETITPLDIERWLTIARH